MAVRMLKRNTAARRQMSVSDFAEITKSKPEKSLLVARKQNAGRNAQGKITIRHRGGGAKRAIRMIDFDFRGIDGAVVTAIEYDPNRSANLALVALPGGGKAYVIATAGLKVGDVLHSTDKAEIKSGNRLPLTQIPVGTTICNIELSPGRGGQMVRSAGAKAQLSSREGGYAQIKLPSGEVRRVLATCYATIGSIGNDSHQNIKIGSAGRKRRMGIRPTVRGKAMNPVDHPHGGGEAGNSIGLKHPKTPWGMPALGKKTRRRKYSNNMIVRARKKGSR